MYVSRVEPCHEVSSKGSNFDLDLDIVGNTQYVHDEIHYRTIYSSTIDDILQKRTVHPVF